MKRRGVRWYGYRYDGFIDLLPRIAVSWCAGSISLHVCWLIWAGELEIAIGG